MKKIMLTVILVSFASVLISVLSSCTDQASVTTEPLPEGAPVLSSARPLSSEKESPVDRSSLEEPLETPSYAPEKEYPELPVSVLAMIWGDSASYNQEDLVYEEFIWGINVYCSEKPSQYLVYQKECLKARGYEREPYIALYLQLADEAFYKNYESWRNEFADLANREDALSRLVNAENPKAENYADGSLACYFEEGIFQKGEAVANLADLTSQKEKAKQQVAALAEELEQKYIDLADRLKTACPYVFVKKDAYYGNFKEEMPIPALFLFATEEELSAMDSELKRLFTASFSFSVQYGVDMNAAYKK